MQTESGLIGGSHNWSFAPRPPLIDCCSDLFNTEPKFEMFFNMILVLKFLEFSWFKIRVIRKYRNKSKVKPYLTKINI